ncbi:MAG: hypothetical protein E2604_09510 [Flavobacterium sp.]|nr:hypothetical protein [Flavobacterium sp.]
MKKYILTVILLVSLYTNSQTVKQKKDFLNDYAVCECLTQTYHNLGIKLNDSSINYWKDANVLSIKQDILFNKFITDYIKRIPLNQAYDGSTNVINYCLSIKEDEAFIKLISKFFKK